VQRAAPVKPILHLSFMNNLLDATPLDGKYLGNISTDFIQVADKLRESSYIIRARGGYAFPVFILSFTPIELGVLLIPKGEAQNQGYYYATYLDALIQAQFIAPDKAANFQAVYKDPDEFCCLLVLDSSHGFAKFLYIPYPVD
jgi:hypothetical protein